jgi:uncharacterized protein with ParB-like and HNH nuclease domain
MPKSKSKSTKVVDESKRDDTVTPVQYEITSFGADYDVEGLVARLRRGDIVVPTFQRDYVWSQKEASRFIESLLLGLPVPGIFLAKERTSNKLIVIDGQQRLKTLQFFYDGFFKPKTREPSKRVFSLQNVQESFANKNYHELDEDQRRTLNDSIMHATIVKQDSPDDDDTSIYHIFERLNTSGRKLTPQQIRVAIYRGAFVDLAKELNRNSDWRQVYGPISKTLKDQELILRFLALLHFRNDYARPMTEFLNKATLRANRQDKKFLEACRKTFLATIKLVQSSLGKTAFRPTRALNAAVLDSVMVGLATRISSKQQAPSKEKVAVAYANLVLDDQYLSQVLKATSDDSAVSGRIDKAINAFAKT